MSKGKEIKEKLRKLFWQILGVAFTLFVEAPILILNKVFRINGAVKWGNNMHDKIMSKVW